MSPVLAPEPTALIRLLEDWQDGKVSPWQVVAAAERLENAAYGSVRFLPDVPDTSPLAAARAVSDLLSSASHSFFLPEDIPACLSYLRATPGNELAAASAFRAYWATIDFESRRDEVTKLYFTPSASRRRESR